MDLFSNDPDLPGKALVLLALGLLVLIPGVGGIVWQFVILGYASMAAQRWARGDRNALPRLAFDGEYLLDLLGAGLRVWIIQLVYSMAYALIMIPMFIIVIALFGIAASQGISELAIVAIVVALILPSIPISLLMSCAFIRGHLSDDVNVGIQPGPAFRMFKTMWKELLVGAIVMIPVSIGLYFAGMLCLCVGIFIAVPAMQILWTIHLTNVYLHYAELTGEHIEIKHHPKADPSPTPYDAPHSF